MAEIAGIFLSPFLQVFFEKMASPEFVDFFGGQTVNDGLLMKLKIKLSSMNEVVEDAEDKQFTNPDVKVWLHTLKAAVYDAEDVLDAIATKDLQRKLDAELGTFGSKVCNFIPTSPFVKKVEKQIEELLDKLDFLLNQKENLGLRVGVGVGGNPSERLPSTSLVDESHIFGRYDHKEAVIHSLLSDGASGDEMGVIAIVGMGGIGKTTLAQLAYNDNKVTEHFNLKVWVCVSNPFDVSVIIKTVLEEIILSDCNVEDRNRLRKELNHIKILDKLQIQLKDALVGKKFLFVLDDVWEMNSTTWEALSNVFKFGAPGSKVIVTTRDFEVARVLHTSATYHITELLEEDCWSLFKKFAFHDSNSNAYLELEAIGRKIVEKCKGLPLAIKAVGALLSSKLNVNEWDKVLRSELWEDTNILSAIRLSYKYLSPHLKRCFAYCSIFPKDYAFKKDKLILLWMAEGFLPQPKNKTMEEVGDDYFLTLVSRSLFQQSNSDEYIMHDLVRDLAKFISKQFAISLVDDCSPNTRHLSICDSGFQEASSSGFQEAKRLRTVLHLNFNWYARNKAKFPFPMARCLRVLILSRCYGIYKLQNSIGKCIHLRYLDLSSTMIKRLPDAICKLCNLQILNLSNCQRLKAWPRNMHKLINLRHLDIAETVIKEMPRHMGKLKYLQTLTKFMVGKHSGFGIEELGKLTNLRGSILVLELQNVEDAKGEILRNVKYLEKLVLEWKFDHTTASESHIIVLDSLQPHSNLKSLGIMGYGSKSFPDWVGHASFSNIASLRLENCKFCCSLPPLGQLSSLQDLSIVGFHGVVTVGHEFYGSGSSSLKPFEALKVLRFNDMLKWEEWFSFDAENECEPFPQLAELYIDDCPMLTRGLPIHLPCLVKLEICKCPQLVASLPRASVLRELELPIHLDYSSLEYLMFGRCDSLKFLPLDLFPKLCRLELRDCRNLESLTVRQQHEHDLFLSLIHIAIHRCPNFVYFPKQGLRAPNLKLFRINDCKSLQSLPDKMHIFLLSLEKLSIKYCPEVESFPEGGLPSNLEEITILDCNKLFARRMVWNLQYLSSLRRFEVFSKVEDVESFPDDGLLPTSLTYLRIKGFPNLTSLNKKVLKNLIALKELSIWDCPKLKCMPEDGLPGSVSTLNISNCPLVEKEWKRKEGEEWRKIAHIECISISISSYCPVI